MLIICLVFMPSTGGRSSACQESPQTAKASPNEWKGLVPLRSTRADVERLLGKPAMSPGSFNIYKTEGERVDVRYSVGPCEASPVERWNVAKDIVISMEVIPQKTISIESLHLDTKRYLRIQESHPENWVQYWNRDDGVILHSILQGKRESLYFIEYRPSSKDKSLRCSDDK
jgi:hypothetical protein